MGSMYILSLLTYISILEVEIKKRFKLLIPGWFYAISEFVLPTIEFK